MGLFVAQVINDDTLNGKTNQRHSHNRDKGGDETPEVTVERSLKLFEVERRDSKNDQECAEDEPDQNGHPQLVTLQNFERELAFESLRRHAVLFD